MATYKYFTPTKVIFGKAAEMQVGILLKEQGAKKILLHYGSGSVIRSGLLDRVKATLAEEQIAYVELGGVVPNPRLSLIRKGIELVKTEQIDFILAVGGGSVVDSAKAIGYGAANEGDVWDFYEHTRQPAACMPLGVILTLAATGSDMSDSSVITNEDGWKKRGCNSDLCRARFAILNPELTLTVSPYQTACGCTDILMHTLERYFTAVPTLDLTDRIAEGLLRTVMENAKILEKDPQNYNARAEMLWANSLSHNGLTGFGSDGGDWVCHPMEHEMSGLWDVAHGAGLAAIWGSWARYTYKQNLPRFCKLAVHVLGVSENGTDEEIALQGIKAMEAFFHSIHMPTSFRELGVNAGDQDLDTLARKYAAAVGGSRGSAVKIGEKEAWEIYTMARAR